MTDEEIASLIGPSRQRYFAHKFRDRNFDAGMERQVDTSVIDPRFSRPPYQSRYEGQKYLGWDEMRDLMTRSGSFDENPHKMEGLSDYFDAFLSAYGYRYGRDGNGFETYTNHRKRKELEAKHNSFEEKVNPHFRKNPFPQYYGPGA